jgi:DNA-binding CsgD family transcriptional regulator
MASDFPPVDFAGIVLHLIEMMEVRVSEMTLETCQDFPALFCRDLALCSQGQIQLVLAGRNDLTNEQLSLHKESIKIPVQGRSNNSGMLILLSPPQEAADRLKTVQYMKMLAGVCRFLLSMFGFTASVLLPLQRADVRNVPQLTEREREVLKLLCQGCNLRQIAQRLDIEKATVEKHKQRIRVKLEVPHELEASHNLEISVIAYLSGLFSPLTDL